MEWPAYASKNAFCLMWRDWKKWDSIGCVFRWVNFAIIEHELTQKHFVGNLLAYKEQLYTHSLTESGKNRVFTLYALWWSEWSVMDKE